MARKSQYPPSVKPGIPKKPHLPNGWYFKSFDEVVEVVERPAQLQDNQEHQLVTAKRSRGGIVPRERLLGEQILTKTQYYTNAGDFLISRRQIIHGACGIVPPELDGAVVSNEYSTLITKPDLLAEYLAYFSHTTYFQQTCFQSSVGVDVEKMIFKLDDWLKYKIPLPPLSEQKKIVAILSSVDDAIASTQAVIDQTRKVKQGLLQQLLTRGIGHTKFKESAIGKIPETWEIVRLVEHITLPTGQVDPKQSPYKELPLIAPNHIESGTGRLLEKVSAEAQRAISGKYLFQPGVVVYSKIRPYLRKAVLVKEEGLCSADMYPLRVKNTLLPGFLLTIVLSEDFSRFADSKSMRTGIPKLNREELSEYICALPPLHEQESIVSVLDSIEQDVEANLQNLISLETLKRGLMQDLLTGRVRV